MVPALPDLALAPSYASHPVAGPRLKFLSQRPWVTPFLSADDNPALCSARHRNGQIKRAVSRRHHGAVLEEIEDAGGGQWRI